MSDQPKRSPAETQPPAEAQPPAESQAPVEPRTSGHGETQPPGDVEAPRAQEDGGPPAPAPPPVDQPSGPGGGDGAGGAADVGNGDQGGHGAGEAAHDDSAGLPPAGDDGGPPPPQDHGGATAQRDAGDGEQAGQGDDVGQEDGAEEFGGDEAAGPPPAGDDGAPPPPEDDGSTEPDAWSAERAGQGDDVGQEDGAEEFGGDEAAGPPPAGDDGAPPPPEDDGSTQPDASSAEQAGQAEPVVPVSGSGGEQPHDDRMAAPPGEEVRQIPSAEVPDGDEGATRDEPIPTPEEGMPLWRTWGEAQDQFGGMERGSLPMGESWTPVDPTGVTDLRESAGLPNENPARFMVEGRLNDPAAVREIRAALELDGNAGGLPEYLIDDPSTNVSVVNVSGVNEPWTYQRGSWSPSRGIEEWT